MNSPKPPLLETLDLRVTYHGHKASVEALRGISFSVASGEVLGLVGASGSGKSSLVNAILGLHSQSTSVTARTLDFEGNDLLHAEATTWANLRGRRLAMIPQHPMTSLAATTPIGRQLDWYLGPNALARYAEDLTTIGLGDVVQRPGDLPAKFSGGQLQRLVIAIATFGSAPSLLVADEPTSTLDTSVQKAVLDLLEEQRRRLDIAMLYISHDLAVVAQICDRVGVMRDGLLVETGTIEAIFNDPQHPYTQALVGSITQMAAIPSSWPNSRPGLPPATGTSEISNNGSTPPKLVTPLLLARNITHRYENASSSLASFALESATLELYPGEIVALVGQSGSGKTTLARIIAGAQEASGGTLWFEDEEMGFERTSTLRRHIQLVSQNQRAALNANRSVKHAMLQALRVHNIGDNRSDRLELIGDILEKVGLSSKYLGRRPTQLSGGEMARTTLARALLLSPKLLILDEPTASLDGPVKLVILELLRTLQQELGLTVLIITHELTVARTLADRVVVMNQGKIVETGRTAQVFTAPIASYTKALLESEPTDPRLV